jgi:hypothetical protein
MRLLDEGEDGRTMPGSMFLHERDRSGEPNTGSGGRARRVYGRSRTILADSMHGSPGSGTGAGADDVVKESYKELRKKFEVDNSGEDVTGDVYAVCPFIQCAFRMELMSRTFWQRGMVKACRTSSPRAKTGGSWINWGISSSQSPTLPALYLYDGPGKPLSVKSSASGIRAES